MNVNGYEIVELTLLVEIALIFNAILEAIGLGIKLTQEN